MRKEGHQDDCRCCGGGASSCGHIADERNRYFTGKYMAARDFQDEQSYFLSRHRLHNRLLHGWGIVCGLRVTHHPDYGRDPDSECARRWMVVHPGIAIDCCGRELIVCRELAVEFKQLPPPAEGDAGDGGSPPPDYEPPRDEPPEGEGYGTPQGYGSAQGPGREQEEPSQEGGQQRRREEFLVVLHYVEDEIEQVPALYHEGGCDPARNEANRVRERAEVLIIPRDEVEGDCWLTSGGSEAPCRDDCADDLFGVGGSCLDPVCPCKEYVPLALVSFDPDDPEGGFEIDLSGRRYLPTPPNLLTHVVGINWPHGGEITLDELNNRMGGRLVVGFDRRLRPAEGEATGINPFTFVVQYGGVQQDIEFLPFAGDGAPTLEDDCHAVFQIDPDYINPDRQSDRKQYDRYNIVGSVVYVTLKCDFILDCHDNPVDGDHLRGRLPSGDGVPGGVFESWFRVVYEKEEAQ